MQRTTISMFAQLVQLMGGKIEFQNLVTHYQSDKGAKELTAWSQFIAMLFANSLGRIHYGRFPTAPFDSEQAQSHRCDSSMSIYPELRQQQAALQTL